MKLSSKFWIIVFAEGIMVCGYSMAFPFLALYLTQNRGFNMSIVGVYFSIVMIISSFSSTIGGSVSDYMGRKKIMFFSLLIRGIFVALITISIKFNFNILWILFFNFVASVGGLGFHSVALAYISDIVCEKNRIKAYSILRVSTNAGWAAGPAIGGFLSNISYSLAFGVSSLVFLFAAFLVLIKAEDIKKNFQSSPKKFYFFYDFNRDFKKILFYSFLMTAVMSQLVIPLSIYSKKYLNFSEKQIGFLFTLNGLIVVVIQYFIGSKIKDSKTVNAIALSCLFYALGYLIFGYSPNYTVAMLSIAVVTLGEVVFSPSLSSLVSSVSPESKRGAYMGIHSMISDLGRSFGVFAGTFLIDKVSGVFREVSWYFVFGLSIFSFFGFLSLKKNSKEEISELTIKKEMDMERPN